MPLSLFSNSLHQQQVCSEENSYFERSFVALEVSPSSADATTPVSCEPATEVSVRTNENEERSDDILPRVATLPLIVNQHYFIQTFIALMQRIAQGGRLDDKLAVLVVCERSYLEWATRVLPSVRPSTPFYYSEWVTLHANEEFAQFVGYLCGLLDELELTEEERGDVQRTFDEAVDLEVAFFDMAFEESG